jgi:hypothetical protein
VHLENGAQRVYLGRASKGAPHTHDGPVVTLGAQL